MQIMLKLKICIVLKMWQTVEPYVLDIQYISTDLGHTLPTPKVIQWNLDNWTAFGTGKNWSDW